MSAQLKELENQLHLRTPGLVALEHHPEAGGAFAHIDIPKFGRRLAFPAQGDGRRVEFVPPDIAQYMIQRFNRNGVVHLTVAYDLMGGQSASGGISQEQFTAMLQQAVTEPWFSEAVRIAVYAGLGAGTSSVGPKADTEDEKPYVPKKRTREG